MKGYAVLKYQVAFDESPDIYCIYTDENDLRTNLEILNKPYNEYSDKQEKCLSCNKDCDEPFRERNSCERAKILTDRHGEYCENDMSDVRDINIYHYGWKTVEIK